MPQQDSRASAHRLKSPNESLNPIPVRHSGDIGGGRPRRSDSAEERLSGPSSSGDCGPAPSAGPHAERSPFSTESIRSYSPTSRSASASHV